MLNSSGSQPPHSNAQPLASPLMVLGTSSGAGKSLMTAALCRVLNDAANVRCPSRART